MFKYTQTKMSKMKTWTDQEENTVKEWDHDDTSTSGPLVYNHCDKTVSPRLVALDRHLDRSVSSTYDRILHCHKSPVDHERRHETDRVTNSLPGKKISNAISNPISNKIRHDKVMSWKVYHSTSGGTTQTGKRPSVLQLISSSSIRSASTKTPVVEVGAKRRPEPPSNSYTQLFGPIGVKIATYGLHCTCVLILLYICVTRLLTKRLCYCHRSCMINYIYEKWNFSESWSCVCQVPCLP